MAGLYLHIPFCQHKCSYCDFYSIENLQEIDRFVEALLREIAMRKDHRHNPARRFDSVFFGGGTPSLLTPLHMERIVTALRTCYEIDDRCEWTMECNPGTTSLQSLSSFRSLGINRISFGVQSFHDDELRFLERIHSADEVVKSYNDARTAGFDNINIDVMFALPGQTRQRFERTLQRVMTLNPEHISAYSLIYEEGTPLHAQLLKGKVQPMAEEEDAALYEYTIETLEANGYVQYEVSNFARPGYQCRHNICYWTHQEYLSFGPSAHGYLGNVRYNNVRNLRRYLNHVEAGNVPTIREEELTSTQSLFEKVFLGLRSIGIDIDVIRATHAVDIVNVINAHHPWMINEGFLKNDGLLRLTRKGFPLCDDITVHVIHAMERHLGQEWERSDDPEEPPEEGEELKKPGEFVQISM